MTAMMLKIAGVWLITILAGLPLFVSMGLACLVFLLLAGMTLVAGLPTSIVVTSRLEAGKRG